MYNLNDLNISYFIINPNKKDQSAFENKMNLERLISVFYSKDITVIPIKEKYSDEYSDCFIGIHQSTDNDEIRKDGLQILNFLDIDHAITKYHGTRDVVQLEKNGKEDLLTYSLYESNEDDKVFFYEGTFFTYKSQQRYFYPKNKGQLKSGMVVEFFNNEKWNKKTIVNLDEEYNKMYSLLIRYNKLRISLK